MSAWVSWATDLEIDDLEAIYRRAAHDGVDGLSFRLAERERAAQSNGAEPKDLPKRSKLTPKQKSEIIQSKGLPYKA